MKTGGKLKQDIEQDALYNKYVILKTKVKK